MHGLCVGAPHWTHGSAHDRGGLASCFFCFVFWALASCSCCFVFWAKDLRPPEASPLHAFCGIKLLLQGVSVDALATQGPSTARGHARALTPVTLTQGGFVERRFGQQVLVHRRPSPPIPYSCEQRSLLQLLPPNPLLPHLRAQGTRT